MAVTPVCHAAWMGRPLRTSSDGQWFHVVNRGAAHADIFVDDRDRIEFGRLLGLAHERHGIDVHAYCLMSNHFHLLVACPDGGLAESMHLVGGVYARHLNERLGRDGPVFRARYFARPVTTDGDVAGVVRYIHRNPLAFVPLGRLETYRWSSLRTYLGHRRVPDWMIVDTVDHIIGGADAMRHLVFGDVGGRAVSDVDWPGVVDLMIDEHLDGGASQGARRTVMAALIDELPRAASRSIIEALAYPTVNAERSARSRARRQLANQCEIRVVVAAALAYAA